MVYNDILYIGLKKYKKNFINSSSNKLKNLPPTYNAIKTNLSKAI